MRTTYALMLLASIFSWGCSDGDDGGNPPGDSGPTGCAAFCARTVGCANDPAADCVSSCQMSSQLCPAESSAARACTAPRPNSDFHCDPEVGVTTVNDGVCQAEGDALFDCLIDAAF